MTKKKPVTPKEKTPFQKFKELAKEVISTPKEEIDRKAAAIKKAKSKRKTA